MKLHLPLALRSALLSVFSVVGISMPAHAKYPIHGEYVINNMGSYCKSGHASDEDFYSNSETRYECGEGGALHINGSLTMSQISNVVLRRNYATDSGGGIRASGITFSSIGNITFSNNLAAGFMNPCDDGYGTWVHGGGALAHCQLIENCDVVSFLYNNASNGSGGAIVNDDYILTIRDCENVRFCYNTAAADGGAISLKHGYYLSVWQGVNCDVYVRNNDFFSFVGNAAKGNGGAIDSWFVGIYGNSNGKFENNKAGVNGGAISADYVYIGNKNSVIQFLNNAAANGGAIYASSYSGYSSSPWRTVYIYDNDNVLFSGNVAERGGAIYCASNSGTAYITNNGRVEFVNNSGGAIYAKSAVRFQGNDYVIFRDNGIAIEAEKEIYLSTTEDAGSSIISYDSVHANTYLYLNTLTPVYNVEGGVANGSIRFIGEKSQNTVASSTTQGAGVVSLEKGATLWVRGSYSLNGGNLSVSQHSDAVTALTVGSNMSMGSTSGILTFDLNYNVITDTPLADVRGKLTMTDGRLAVDDSGLTGNPANIALLTLGGDLVYGGKTYSYENDEWFYTSGGTRHVLTPDALLSDSAALQPGATLLWQDKTLYYKTGNTGTWQWKVKGLGSETTWRGDVLDWYDTNKLRVEMGTREKDFSCWVAAASNVVQYWQDRYAPLYQGEEPLTTNQFSGISTAHRVYQQLNDKLNGKASGGVTDDAVKLWFASASGKGFTSNSGVWNEFGVDVKNLSVKSLGYDDFRKSFEQAFLNSESGIALGFGFYGRDEDSAQLERQFGHGVTVWSAEFYTNSQQEQFCELQYTDSDFDTLRLNKMVIKFSNECGAYIYQYQINGNVADENLFLDGRVSVIEVLTYIETPYGMADMLTDYNSDNTFHWTGKAAGKKWTTQEKENWYEGSHLATAADGWKKECSGGGKTIYAHAYVTAEQMGAAHFIFDEAVDGKPLGVAQRYVVLEESISPASVTVRNTYYQWKGSGTLLNSKLTVETGALCLSGTHIKGCTIELDGSISNDTEGGSTIQNSTIATNGRGELWFGSIAVSEVAAGQNGITIDGNTFAVLGIENGLLVNRIEGGCLMGATLDFQGAEYNGTVAELAENAALNRAFYDSLAADGNTLEGDVEAYDWAYLPVNFSAQIDGSRNEGGQLVVAQSTLTITTPTGAEGVLRTIGSHSVSPNETSADISISEKLGGIVSSDVVLMTLPTEETYLSAATSITTPELLVAEESRVTNEGRIAGDIVVEAFGTLCGSGTFGGTTVYESGRLVVGSSPGAPEYESLTMQSGSELVFCLDGTKAATASEHGWGSGTYSVLHVTQQDGLTVESGTAVHVGCSLDFLNASPLGDVQTLSLVQLSGPGSDALLAALQAGTAFSLADAADELSALADVGAVVHHAAWKQGAEHALELSFIVSSLPADALIWTNNSADGKWNNSSVNWQDADGADSAFADGRNVAFYQAAEVEIADTVTPGDIVVSTPEDVSWSGSGRVAGSGSLIKEGSGELRICLSNTDYTGYVDVRGGKLTAAADNALGSAWVDVNNASLDLGNRLSQNVVSLSGESVLSGAAELNNLVLNVDSRSTVQGGYHVSSGRSLMIGGNSSYTGSLTLGGGTVYFLDKGLQVNGSTVFVSGTTTTLDLSDWAGETSGAITLAMLGSVSGYTEESLTLSGLDEEAWLLLDEKSGALVLSFDEPVAPPSGDEPGSGEEPPSGDEPGAGDEPLPDEPGDVVPPVGDDTPAPLPPSSPITPVKWSLSQNQHAVYAALQSIAESGAAEGELAAMAEAVLTAENEATVQQLLDAMGGAEYTTMMSSQIEGNLGHLRRLRAAVGSGETVVPQHGPGFYVSAFNSDTDVESDATGPGYTRTEWGAHLGVEARPTEHMLMGLGVEQSRARVMPSGAARYHEDATRVDAYLAYAEGGWRMLGSMGVGQHDYDLRRRTPDGREARAESLGGSSVNMMAELSYTASLSEQHLLQPFAVVESSYNKLDSFIEEGVGSVSLSGDGRKAWSTDVTLGLRYLYNFAVVSGAPAATLNLHSGVVLSIGDTTADLNMHFAGAESRFTQRGANRNRRGYSVGMGVTVPLDNTTALFGNAESILSGDTDRFDAQIGLRLAF